MTSPSSREEFQRAIEVVVPTTFILRMFSAYNKWAFGESIDPAIPIREEELIDRWNLLHADEWVITEEESNETNFEIVAALWEEEIFNMVDMYFNGESQGEE